MKQLLFIATLFLVSCSKMENTGTSVWGGGLWILPWLTGLGSLVFLGLAYRSSKSNSTKQTKNGTIDNTGNVPITQLGLFWFGAALALATIIILIVVNSSK